MDNKYNWDNKNTRKSNKTYLCFKDKQYGKILSCHENYYYLLFNIIFKQLVMRMLRKLFLPVILFGTLLVSTSIGFVSCSDDYDDSVVTANVSSLQTKLSALQAIQDALPTADEIAAAKVAATAEVDAAKAEATAAVDAAKAEAMQAAVDADVAQLAIINTSIDSLATVLHTAIDSKVNADDVNTAIDAALVTINAKIASLTVLNVKSMLNDIEIITDHSSESWYYGVVGSDVTFGPNKEISLVKDQEINVLSMELYATANPSNVNWSLYDLAFVNSAGEVLPVIKFNTPEINTTVWTKASTINNIWKMTTTQNWDDVDEQSDLYNTYMTTTSGKVEFCLAATDSTDRRIQSEKSVTFDRVAFTAVNGLTLEADSNINAFNSDVIFSLMNGVNSIIGSTTPVYKKYITLTDPTTYEAASFTGLNTLMDNNDTIIVQCTNEAYNNKSIDFTVNYLNYDGTTSFATKSVIFTKLAYKDVTITLNSAIDFAKAIDAQTSEMKLVTDFSTEVGTFADYITDNGVNNIMVESSTIGGTVLALPFDAITDPATLNFYKADGTTVLASMDLGSTISGATITNAFSNDLNKIAITYSANTGFVDAVGNYGVKLTFLNSANNVINYLYLVLNVTAPADPSVKLTATWNTDLSVANVWAEVTGANATYDMNNSYMNIPTSFAYNETDNAMSFAGDVLSIPNYSTIAARPSQNYSVTSTCNEFMGGVTSSDWTIPYTFDVHMRSAVNEATPGFAVPTAANASLIYKNTSDNSKEVLNISSIIATDPSDISQTIEYTPTIDPRIESIKYTIVDENSVAGSSNAGLALFSTSTGYTSTITVTSATTNLISIASAFHATPALAPAAVTTDVTLNLQMEITDVFGFKKTVTLPFTVKKNQN